MMPWLGNPTSYASGYIRHQRTVASSQSLIWALSSPPTYWTGLRTFGSSGSRRGQSDSTGIAPKVVVRVKCVAGPASVDQRDDLAFTRGHHIGAAQPDVFDQP